MAASVPSPAKRRKEDPTPSPLLLAAGWSALPPDLVRRVADSLLATNDLDCYMDYRAVCSGWRAATDDPRSDAYDHRFRTGRWIVLDEVFQSQGKEVLLLNTHTGRFLRKNLPQLGDYCIVATTRSGYFVLAEKSPPHAARVLNPLTGIVIRFSAPVPPEVGSAAVFFDHSSLVLTLFCDSSHNVYTAGRNTIGFIVHECPGPGAAYDFFRKAVLGGVCSDIELAVHNVLDDVCSFLMSGDVDKFFPRGLPDVNDLKWFPVDLGRHMLFVLNSEGLIFVLKKDIQIGKLVALNSISNYAIFIGHQRCLAVDADKFPAIEVNCVYYIEILGSSAHICKCNIKDRKVERISEAADFVKHDKQFVLVANRPSTIIHLLSSYTINIPDSQLALQQIP